MPSVSDRQQKFMQAIAHNAAFARKVDVPQDVGKEFAKADEKAKTFSKRLPYRK